MKCSYIQTLIEVARTGSISKAAELLCISQPAVTKRIRFLEEWYGHALLVRVGKSQQLTVAGRLVVEKGGKLLEIEEDLLRTLRNLSSKNRISFSCTSGFGTCHLPKILKKFMLRYTNQIDLNFTFEMSHGIMKGLRNGEYDVAVIEHCDYFDISAFPNRDLPRHSMVFLSSPALGIDAPVAPIEQLFDKTLFIRKEGCCSRILLEKNLQQIGSDIGNFRNTVVYDDFSVIINAVVEGCGITFTSSDLVADLATGAVTEHRIDGFSHVMERSLVFRDGERRECLRLFEEAMEDYFGLPSCRNGGEDPACR